MSTISHRSHPNHAMLIVVMGVSGTGKSTLGHALSSAFDMPYIEGDDLHPKANIDKMASNHPLTDADREPWLELVRTTSEHKATEQHIDPNSSTRSGVIIGCSALKRYYRDILRGTKKPHAVPEHLEPTDPDTFPTYFVYLYGSKELLMQRVEARQGHYMKAQMLESQFETLESPEGENGVIAVSIEDSIEKQVRKVRESLATLAGPL